MGGHPKTIDLLLYDGTMDGIVSAESSSWNGGLLFASPRAFVGDLVAGEACSRFGVYLLLSDDAIYVGQSTDLAKRVEQHIAGKDWWERVVVLTTKDDSLDHADIDYLESELIRRAMELPGMRCDNRNCGNKLKVQRFREVFLSQYLDEALALLPHVGVHAFSCRHAADRGRSHISAGTMGVHDRLAVGKRAKSDAVEYAASCGIALGRDISYANLQQSTGRFWANPQVRLLGVDWDLLLNDTSTHEIVVLRVPAHTLHIAEEGEQGLQTRADKPELLDLNIQRTTLVDAKTGIDLSRFVVARLGY